VAEEWYVEKGFTPCPPLLGPTPTPARVRDYHSRRWV